MAKKVLDENWSDYDDKKKKTRDASFFSCEESWEREYLIRKIRKVYPQYSEAAITAAISACCMQVRAPRPRKAFVECVMERLRA